MNKMLYRVVDGRGASTVTSSLIVANDLVKKTMSSMNMNIDIDNDFIEFQSIDLNELEQPIVWEDLLDCFNTDIAWIPLAPNFGDHPTKWEKVVRHI